MSDKSKLYELLAEYESPHVLEIGVAQAENALNMFKACPSMSYVGVDEWRLRPDMEHEANKLKNWNTQEKWDAIYEKALIALLPCDAMLHRISSHIVLPILQSRFDVIVVDGDHSFWGAWADLSNAWKLLDMGGFIFVDDVELDSISSALKAFLHQCPAAELIGTNIIREK